MQCFLCFINVTGLREARNVDAISAAQLRRQLNCLSAKDNGFIETSFHIMGGRESYIEQSSLRIVRAHANSLLAMCNRFFGSVCQCERQGKVPVGGSKIRVEVERLCELLDRLVSRSFGVSNKTECEMCPGVAAIE